MPNPTRRTVLGAGTVTAATAIGVGAGLTRHVHHKIAATPPQPPTTLTTAVTAHRLLIAGCDAVVSASGANLGTLRAELVSHVQALLAVLQSYPGWRLAPTESGAAAGSTSSAPPPPAVATVAGLRSALQNQAARLASGCRDWPVGEPEAMVVVPLLGSISACLTGHLGLLP